MNATSFRPRLCPAFCVFMLTVFLSTGCGDGVDARVTSARGRLVLATLPENELAVSRIRKSLKAKGAPPAYEVVVRGKIHAGVMPPWEDGTAAFLLTDAAGHDGEEESDHDPHTCSYCSKNIKDYIAHVAFHEAGSVMDIDSRKLFDVTEKQLVLIKGIASMGDDDLLKIEASGIHIIR